MQNDNNMTRPGVLDQVSETQMQELEQQFEQGDRSDWNTLVESYGWSSADGDAVWSWFDQRPGRNAADAFGSSAG